MKQRTVVITQPNYLPWLGYFEQIQRSDVFVFLDCVQFERREWQNRNRIKNFQTGDFVWLTVPTKQKGNFHGAIKDVEINYSEDWISQHLNSVKHNYSRTKYFKEIFGLIENGLKQKNERLRDLNVFFIKEISNLLGLKTEFVFASDLNPIGKKTDLLIDICKKVGATNYYSSVGAKAYMEPEECKFVENRIVLEYQNYIHPVYPQLGDVFLGYMSAIDYLFNVGVEVQTAHE